LASSVDGLAQPWVERIEHRAGEVAKVSRQGSLDRDGLEGVVTETSMAAYRIVAERDGRVLPRPFRVAIIGARGYPSTYGGYETFVRTIAPWLRDHGADVTVYCRDAGMRFRKRSLDGISLIDSPGLDSKSLSTLSHGFSACLHAATQHFDAVLVMNVANGYALPFLRLRGIPIVLNVDGIEWERSKWSRIAKAVFRVGARLSARLSTELVVDAKALGPVWVNRFGVETNYIAYGAPVVADVDPTPVIAKGLEPGGYLLIVARLAPENNVELWLDALDRLDHRYPTVVVGSANYENPVEDRLRLLDRQHPNFHWLGHVSDQDLLTSLWAHAAIYLHGHSVGGTNPALLQALGAGCCVLAIDNAFNREVLQDDRSLVRADAEVIATRIARMMGDPHLRTELAERGPDIITHRYAWDDVCKSYAELLMQSARRTRQRSVSARLRRLVARKKKV